MAALILERAETVRAEARRLREEDRRLRERMVAIRDRQQELLVGAALETRHAREIGERPRPSPWSGLEWRLPDDELALVLVPLD